MANWAQLPPELMVSISNRLNGEAFGVTRVRSVCRSWRVSVPLPRRNPPPERLPVWVSPSDLAHGNVPPGYFKLTQSMVYVVEQVVNCHDLCASSSSSMESKRWLVKLQKAVTPGKMRVSPLLASYHICHGVEMFPKVLDLSNLRVSEVCRGYDLEYTQEKRVALAFCGDYYSLRAEKVVVSLNNGGEDFTAMAIHSGGKLALMRAEDKEWTVIDNITTRYEDVICYKKRFYVVDWSGRAFTFDSQYHLSEIAQVPGGGRGGDKKCFVESKSTGDLLLVDMYKKDVAGEDFTTITEQLKVYRMKKEMQRWEEVGSLGNESLFLGDDCAFSLAEQDLPGLPGNFIFFKDQQFGEGNKDSDALRWFLSDDMGVFNMEDKSARPLAANAGIRSLFWPPSELGL